MKRVVIVLFTLVIGVSLVNLNNNITKSEDLNEAPNGIIFTGTGFTDGSNNEITGQALIDAGITDFTTQTTPASATFSKDITGTNHSAFQIKENFVMNVDSSEDVTNITTNGYSTIYLTNNNGVKLTINGTGNGKNIKVAPGTAKAVSHKNDNNTSTLELNNVIIDFENTTNDGSTVTIPNLIIGDNTVVTIKNNGSGGALYCHSSDVSMPENYEILGSTTDGSGTLLPAERKGTGQYQINIGSEGSENWVTAKYIVIRPINYTAGATFVKDNENNYHLYKSNGTEYSKQYWDVVGDKLVLKGIDINTPEQYGLCMKAGSGLILQGDNKITLNNSLSNDVRGLYIDDFSLIPNFDISGSGTLKIDMSAVSSTDAGNKMIGGIEGYNITVNSTIKIIDKATATRSSTKTCVAGIVAGGTLLVSSGGIDIDLDSKADGVAGLYGYDVNIAGGTIIIKVNSTSTVGHLGNFGTEGIVTFHSIKQTGGDMTINVKNTNNSAYIICERTMQASTNDAGSGIYFMGGNLSMDINDSTQGSLMFAGGNDTTPGELVISNIEYVSTPYKTLVKDVTIEDTNDKTIKVNTIVDPNGKHLKSLVIKGVYVPPTPTPSPIKDNSCEKVIGPSWHWNNSKGVCEEVPVVGTYTR